MLLALSVGVALLNLQSGQVRAELVSSLAAVKAGEPFTVGIVLRMEPGWHVYWKNPGDSGSPVKVEWKLPAGWTAGELTWPTPLRFQEQNLATYGYEGSTILLCQINPSADTRVGPSSMSAKVDWTACREACITGTSTQRLSLTVMPVKATPSRVWGDRIKAAQDAMPKALDDWKFEAAPIDGGFVLRVTPKEKQDFNHGLPSFYSSDLGVLDASYPQRVLMREDGSFWVGLKKSSALQNMPERFRGLLIAPKGSRWNDSMGAILVDVPISGK